MAEEKSLIYQVAQKSFEEATATSLGATFNVIISFHLKQKFGKDPYEVLIVNPHLFYEGLEEVLNEGSVAVIALVGTYLVAKYKINCTPDEFTHLFTENSVDSSQKISAIFKTIIAQEEQKLA
jgi:hypothetical protein